MPGPVCAGESRAGGVDAAHLEAERGAVAEEDPIADRAMHRVVREAVGRRILVIEARVSPEDIEQGATGAEVQHQAGAA